DAFFFDHADTEPGEVVLAGRIHSRHLRGLAADQGAAGELAAARDAFHHFGGDALVELAAGEVVEKEKRLDALHEDIVRAHRDEIDSEPAVASEGERVL